MNEDFVSFDLAKKLKEKGFNQPCLAHYTNGKFDYNIAYFDVVTLPDLYENWDHGAGCFVDAPTIAQVLKWLRDKNIILSLYPSYFKGENCLGWDCDIWVNGNYEHRCVSDNSYESAALAGIEYVIDNLI